MGTKDCWFTIKVSGNSKQRRKGLRQIKRNPNVDLSNSHIYYNEWTCAKSDNSNYTPVL